MRQLADAMSRRAEGSLPSQPLGNPKGKGQMFVVDGADHQEPYDISALRSDYEEESTKHRTRSPPFLKALEKPSPSVTDREVGMQDMIEMLRAVCINLPLVDASQVPAYVRFLKEMCTKKRRYKKIPDSIMLSEEASSLIQRRIQEKLADPGAPVIPCVIGNIRI
ncbi:unnamed protein product [Victoria cruziana]